jgi:hypothetical protein
MPRPSKGGQERAGERRQWPRPAYNRPRPVRRRSRPPTEPAPKPEVKPALEARRYKVDLPPAADIVLDVARTDANGTKWSGDALLSWTLTPSTYKVRVEAGIASCSRT